MKTFSRWAVTTLIFITVSISNVTHAVLIDRGDGMVYDDDLDITWLTYSTPMTWYAAMEWTANLEHGGFSDWRLPTTLQPDLTCTSQTVLQDGTPFSDGYNCSGSELGHLQYVELGGEELWGLRRSSDPDLALFPDLKFGEYWSQTVAPTSRALESAFFTDFSSGYQGTGNRNLLKWVFAVRDGDVASVPLPASIWLFSTGLVSLLFFTRRKRG